MKRENRIDRVLKTLKRQRRKALIGYLTAGYPTKSAFKRLVPLLEKGGLDLLEIGIPFSDPIADGVTIQHSSQVALAQGVTLDWVLQTVLALRARVELPLIFMSYTNPILAMGIEPFFRAARHAGVDGLIIPDLSPEEAARFEKAARRHAVHLIFLVSPTTPRARIAAIGRRTQGFLYAVALSGVTGARRRLDAALPAFLKTVKQLSPRPVMVGFGLSTPDQVAQAARHVDGVIVGSALIKSITASQKSGFRGTATFVRSLRQALDRAAAAQKGASHAS